MQSVIKKKIKSEKGSTEWIMKNWKARESLVLINVVTIGLESSKSNQFF